jgi:hypothetical protein
MADSAKTLASRTIESQLGLASIGVGSSQIHISIVEPGCHDLFGHPVQSRLPLLASLPLVGIKILEEHSTMCSNMMKWQLALIEETNEELSGYSKEIGGSLSRQRLVLVHQEYGLLMFHRLNDDYE